MESTLKTLSLLDLQESIPLSSLKKAKQDILFIVSSCILPCVDSETRSSLSTRLGIQYTNHPENIQICIQSCSLLTAPILSKTPSILASFAMKHLTEIYASLINLSPENSAANSLLDQLITRYIILT